MRFDSKTGDYRKVSQFPLRKRIAPCDTLITDNGEFIVTFDDWASIGVSGRVKPASRERVKTSHL